MKSSGNVCVSIGVLCKVGAAKIREAGFPSPPKQE